MSMLKQKLEIEVQEAELAAQKTLSQYPTIARWFLVAGILALIPAYFIAKNVSKNIWLSRYSQNLPIAKKSFSDPKGLKSSPVSVTVLGDSVYAAIAEVTNENLDLSAKDISYKFNFYDSNRQLLYESPLDTFFILPNQKKYLTVPRFVTTKPLAFTELVLSPEVHWQKRLNIPSISLKTYSPATYMQFSPAAFVVEGDFMNQSPYALGSVRLTFVLYDSNNQIIGLSRRDEFTVAPFERRSYKQLWPGISPGNFSRVEVVAETNPLDPNNLSIPFDASSNASDLSHPENTRQ